MVRGFLAAILLGGCAATARDTPAPDDPGRATVVLVSLDGFRWDYLDRGLTPNLSRLAREGVRAEAMVPVFPTKTFPNHYTIVTGRYPAGHGVVGNVFSAPDVGRRLTLSDRDAVRDARFYRAEPIWVTAERQGQRTAPLFWPGSEAPINGVRPSYALPYDGGMPDTARVRRLLQWLDLPFQRRPTFLTLYSSAVDYAGHEYGPDTPETNRAIAQVDSLIGLLATGLAERERAAGTNLVIVSDHGMVSTGPGRVVWLDDYLSRRCDAGGRDVHAAHRLARRGIGGFRVPRVEAGASSRRLSPRGAARPVPPRRQPAGRAGGRDRRRGVDDRMAACAGRQLSHPPGESRIRRLALLDVGDLPGTRTRFSAGPHPAALPEHPCLSPAGGGARSHPGPDRRVARLGARDARGVRPCEDPPGPPATPPAHSGTAAPSRSDHAASGSRSSASAPAAS